LTDGQRQQKVRNFLKKLSRVGADAREMRPFIKTLDVGLNPYGVRTNPHVKTFDRKKFHFGHENNLGPSNEGTIQFPNSSGQGYDQDHEKHCCHQVALKHGYSYSHTTPINQRDGEILHHHSWSDPAGHKIGSYENSDQWSSKVSSSSGHVWQGRTAKELDKHLANKAKRYKHQNNESVANLPILEQLLDPEGHAKVQRYADWMNKNPEQQFGHSIEHKSAAHDLIEVEKLRAKSDKLFGSNDPVSFNNLFEMRSGRKK
jgi:hypothetical protein